MAASRTNPGPVLRRLASLPDAPSAGRVVFHTGYGCGLLYNGTRWITLDGAGSLWPAAAEVVGGAPVVLEDGELRPIDPATDERASGVCSAVIDGLGLLISEGPVPRAFADLATGETYVVGADGALTTEIDMDVHLLRVGYAATPTVFIVCLDQAILA